MSKRSSAVSKYLTKSPYRNLIRLRLNSSLTIRHFKKAREFPSTAVIVSAPILCRAKLCPPSRGPSSKTDLPEMLKRLSGHATLLTLNKSIHPEFDTRGRRESHSPLNISTVDCAF